MLSVKKIENKFTSNMYRRHVVASRVGSCYDVLRTSDLWERGPERCGEAHIIGYAAYSLRKWLLKPYRDN